MKIRVLPLAAALAAVLGTSACGSSASHSTTQAAAQTPAARQEAAASSQPAPPPPTTPMDNWCSGGDSGSGGFQYLQAVENDLNQLKADEGTTNESTDGTQLFNDTVVAGRKENWPPGSNTVKLDYGLYMGFMLAAGAKISQGDIDGATTSLTEAVKYNSTIQKLLTDCGY